MELRIAVCDDRLEDRTQLCTLLRQSCPHAELEAFSSGEALFWKHEDGKRFDLYFLDIFMDGVSGIETARQIRSKDNNALIVFASTSDDFYRESYDLFAFHYLLKPITKDKLAPVIERAKEQLQREVEQTILINCNRQVRSIRLSNLLYLSSSNHNLSFHMKNHELIEVRGKLDDYIAKLPQVMFFRCHQSYVINLRHCTALTADGFQLCDKVIPVSRSYQKEALSRFSNNLISEFGEVTL
jgi:DNA-binding LytR/AlgR family response regulator